ncbi:hypothetical protein BU25DRAFT_484336 [Macroventuria anomochaeta]|uniref:Uncharacterized protein n=1 Tax=Macroventuria anomochaeta TaxID=301207 RepID=A0ACB6SAE4_9PLEO|nr:uncharacterized protein BU25DRAFT_484336 [Macroventuria anomochaeta]KAF2630323.1 hypothetical protein BU25DRAFT_484336 [Macroventuria anomochaeta]
MSNRKKDVLLADCFIQITHSHPTPALDPSTYKLKAPLNVLIIDASRGIGASIAYAYARAGTAKLILAARASSSKELYAVVQQASCLNPSVPISYVPVNITSPSRVATCAGGDLQDSKDIFDFDVQGTYLVGHHFIPLLRKSDGTKTFIAVNSFAALITSGHIANTAYCVSKLAQARLMEYVAEYMMPCTSTYVDFGACLLTDIDLTDDAGLCGTFCVWLSREKRMWLNGRPISATWNVDDLLEKRGQVEDEDLLRIGFRVGDASAASLSQL